MAQWDREEDPMSRTLVMGDVHGAARALEQVFERSAFSPDHDRLICLGDICDGWPEVDRCFDLLLPVRDLSLILGNHDEWAASWMLHDDPPFGWFAQGGDATVDSYARRMGLPPPATPAEARAVARGVPIEHSDLLRHAMPFLIEEDDGGTRRLFAHAGWNPGRPPEAQTGHDLRLGRELWVQARMREAAGVDGPDGPDGPDGRITEFHEVYIGHTPTEWREPRSVLEIWNLDQGAGWDGVLTLMDLHTHEYWQSDPVPGFYPGVAGRA